MSSDLAPTSRELGGILSECDVRAIVKLLGDVIVSRQDFSGVKRQLVRRGSASGFGPRIFAGPARFVLHGHIAPIPQMRE